MAVALHLAADHIRALSAQEWLRRCLVCGCALALILAGEALPGI